MDGWMDGWGWCHALGMYHSRVRDAAASIHPSIHLSIYRDLQQAFLHTPRLVDLRTT